MFNRSALLSFLNDQSGAVSVGWVAMTAGVLGLMFFPVGAMSDHMWSYAVQVAENVVAQTPDV